MIVNEVRTAKTRDPHVDLTVRDLDSNKRITPQGQEIRENDKSAS